MVVPSETLYLRQTPRDPEEQGWIGGFNIVQSPPSKIKNPRLGWIFADVIVVVQTINVY